LYCYLRLWQVAAISCQPPHAKPVTPVVTGVDTTHISTDIDVSGKVPGWMPVVPLCVVPRCHKSPLMQWRRD
jgi:hypothetical protein